MKRDLPTTIMAIERDEGELPVSGGGGTTQPDSGPCIVMTDEDAKDFLPPFPICLATYQARREMGDPPHVALRKTLEVWRELWRS
jgi:hypothetical protein